MALRPEDNKKEEDEPTPPLNPPYPWEVVGFPYGLVKVPAEPPLKSVLGIPRLAGEGGV